MTMKELTSTITDSGARVVKKTSTMSYSSVGVVVGDLEFRTAAVGVSDGNAVEIVAVRTRVERRQIEHNQ